MVNLSFRLDGDSIPIDYAYKLYGSLCKKIKTLHGNDLVGIHPIRGTKSAPGRWLLNRGSRLRFRLPPRLIGDYLGLAGGTITIGDDTIRVCNATVEELTAPPDLYSRMVTVQRAMTPQQMVFSAMSQLSRMGVSEKARVAIIPHPEHDQDPSKSRVVIRVHDATIVGYALAVLGLTADESILVQERGIGGKRRMGCGIFVDPGECY